MTHAGNVLYLVTLTSDPKINGFSGLTVYHVYVKFGDSSCIAFLRYRCTNIPYKWTQNVAQHHTHATTVGTDKYNTQLDQVS